jgi:hypothetical protein
MFNIRLAHYKALVMMLFLLLTTFQALAQTPTPTTPTDTILLLRDNQLVSVASSAARPVTISAVPMPLGLETFNPASTEWRIWSANIDSSGRYLYTIEASGRSDRQLPAATRLVKTDLTTGIRTVLSDRNGMFTFVLSPDQQQMVVGYYDGEFGVAERRSCVLEISTQECREIPLTIGTNPGYWIDNQSYLAYGGGLYIVNATTGVMESIMTPQVWFVYSAVPIPNTRTILINADIRSTAVSEVSHFFTYDLDSTSFSELLYRPLNQDYDIVEGYSFSPNEVYLLYGGRQMALTEFATGRLIREFDSVLNYGWLDDNTLIIQGALDQATAGILRVNAATGEVTQLAPVSASNGILLVP